MELETLRYPIGKFKIAKNFTAKDLEHAIATIEKFPRRLRSTISPLTDDQLDTRYRPGGWTVRQVVHHCADSHINSLIRFKWTLTEENPTIKAYLEDLWAELSDSKLPVNHSIKILEGIHFRWVALLKSMTSEQFSRTFVHPQTQTKMTLVETTAMYAWHCRHHLAHIQKLIERNNW